MIPLVEHFFSIQGEGRYAGVPSIFLRFGGCNLRCPGFGRYEIGGETVYGCDTIWAVDAGRFKNTWRPIDSTDLLERIVEDYMAPLDYRPDVVITGGEPMIYGNDPVFYGLVERLIARGFRVTIETNATLSPDFSEYPAYHNVIFAMAVKLSNSGEPPQKRVVPDVIERMAKEGCHSFFKFTLDSDLIASGAHNEIESICREYENEVFCMPLGDTQETLSEHAESVAMFCLKHGYRYGDRLQIRLWNDENRR